MPRIIGIDIPPRKRLLISLTYIYGIGRTLSAEVIQKAGLDPNMRTHNLGDDDISKLNSILQTDFLVEGDLRRHVQGNIKRLISINAYRGQRHRQGMPTRGQRTRCNARSRKGKKKTVAGKKKAV